MKNRLQNVFYYFIILLLDQYCTKGNISRDHTRKHYGYKEKYQYVILEINCPLNDPVLYKAKLSLFSKKRNYHCFLKNNYVVICSLICNKKNSDLQLKQLV